MPARWHEPTPGVATAIAISAYLGTSDTFDGAVADFSEAYADQNERDYAAFKAAIADGRIAAVEG